MIRWFYIIHRNMYLLLVNLMITMSNNARSICPPTTRKSKSPLERYTLCVLIFSQKKSGSFLGIKDFGNIHQNPMTRCVQTCVQCWIMQRRCMDFRWFQWLKRFQDSVWDGAFGLWKPAGEARGRSKGPTEMKSRIILNHFGCFRSFSFSEQFWIFRLFCLSFQSFLQLLNIWCSVWLKEVWPLELSWWPHSLRIEVSKPCIRYACT